MKPITKFCLGHAATTKLMDLPLLFEKLYWWPRSSWSRGKGRLCAISVPSFGSSIHQWFAQKSWNRLAVFFCKEGEPTSARHCFLHGAWRNALVSEKDRFHQPWLEALKLIYLATRERQLAAVPPPFFSCCKAGRPAAILKNISRCTLSRGNQGLNYTSWWAKQGVFMLTWQISNCFPKDFTFSLFQFLQFTSGLSYSHVPAFSFVLFLALSVKANL